MRRAWACARGFCSCGTGIRAHTLAALITCAACDTYNRRELLRLAAAVRGTDERLADVLARCAE
jgi:hypothetical protein